MLDKHTPLRYPEMRGLSVACILLRIALAAVLLSAVADRFGMWGSPGTPSVAWGTFAAFLVYTAKLNPWCPTSLIPALGWFVTVAEIVLGVGLLAGYRLRITAMLTAILTGFFAMAMTITLGVHAPLNYSVFVVVTGAFLLSQVSQSTALLQKEPIG